MTEEERRTDADSVEPERPQSFLNATVQDAREPDEADELYPNTAEGFVPGLTPARREDEETAAEVAPGMPGEGIRTPRTADRDLNEGAGPALDDEERGVGGTVLGWTGLALSILSFFVFPIVFGAAGAVTGFFAYRQGARTVGMWAMGLGALAILGSFILTPFFVR